MIQTPLNKSGNKKLRAFCILVVVLIVGYFVYKYVYIQVEGRKYDQATVAIKKVAADLKAQGIETTFSRGCQHANPETDTGPLSCSVNLTYSSNQNRSNSTVILNKMFISIKNLNFIKFETKINESSFNIDNDFSVNFKLGNTDLKCSISYTDQYQRDYSTGIYCGNISQFKVY